jgi:hypothetical protein
MFRRHSLGIEIEPEVLTGKRPDFRVTLQSGEVLYVEATLVSESLENTGPKGAMNHLLDIIDKIASDDFFVDVEVEEPLSGYPSARDVKHPIERWHKTLVYEDIAAAWKHGGTSKYELRLKVAGGEIVLCPIPKTRRGFPGRFIGSGPSTSGWLDTSSKIRKDLIKKACKYGPLDSPLLVAINVISVNPERDDIVNALFGTEIVEVLIFNDASRESHHSRQKGGVWNRTRYRRLSSVLWANSLGPWNVGNRSLEIVKNPWAYRPLPDLGFQLPTLEPLAGELSFVDGLPLTELLNLPASWPMEQDC